MESDEERDTEREKGSNPTVPFRYDGEFPHSSLSDVAVVSGVWRMGYPPWGERLTRNIKEGHQEGRRAVYARARYRRDF